MRVRTITTALSALVVVSLMVGDPAGGAVGGDWPQYGHGPAHAGYQPFETQIAPGTVASLDVLWRRDLTPRGGHSSEVYAAPVVADGLVFTGPMRAYVSHGLLWALDVRTGTPRWKTTDLGYLVAPPAVSQGIVVVNAGVATVGETVGEAIAFDAATGGTLWRHHTVFGGTEGENFQGVAPVIAHGIVVVSVTGETFEGDRLGKLWAFDLVTGDVVWTRRQTWGRPAVAGDTVFVPDATWDPVARSRANHLLAIDLEDGTLRWRIPLGGRHAVVGAPSVSEGVVFVSLERSGDDAVVALAPDDGTVLHKVFVNARPNTLSPPMIAPGRVVVETFGGALLAFTTDLDPVWTGRIVRPEPLDLWTCVEASCASPGGANGVVFAVAGDRIRAFRLEDGRSLWSWRIGTGAIGNVSSPAISNGTVFSGSNSGYLYAFG
jgi:outer membrane protein assembly factor BamB